MTDLSNFHGLTHNDIFNVVKGVIGKERYQWIKENFPNGVDTHIVDGRKSYLMIDIPLVKGGERVGFEVHIYSNGNVKYDNGMGVSMALVNPMKVYKTMSLKWQF